MIGADFWFINPAGVAFGPNATLDVPASFHVSTADELGFPGGEVFSATDPAKSVLSVAVPEAFGFLSAQPAPISVDVGPGKAFGLLSLLSAGETLSFTGGDITITGNPGSSILTLGGEIDFVSLASPGEVRLGAVATASEFGSLQIKGPSPIGTQAQFTVESGGTIHIRAGQVKLNDVALSVLNYGLFNAAGGIFIAADNVDLGGANYIFTGSLSEEAPGRMEIEAKNLRIGGTGGIGTFGLGASGDVIITADAIEIDGTTGRIGIVTSAVGDAPGGAITITAHQGLWLHGSGAIVTSSAILNSGNAGSITINAGSTAIEDGARIGADTFSAGQGGNITVTGGTLRLTNGSAITNTSSGSGNAGTITINAGNIAVDGARIGADTISAGRGGDITITGSTLRLTNRGEITSTAGGGGAAGKISVGPLDEIWMSNGGVISAETFGDGDAGGVTVEAPRISVNNSYIGANTGGAGNAGPVTVTATDQLTFTNEGRVFNGTSGSGNGGDITVTAGTLIADKQPIDHPHVYHTGISASPQAGSSGNGGNVIIKAGTIILRNGAQITTDTKGTGNAGSIDITMGSTLRLEDDGLIGTCSGAGPDCKDRTNSFGSTGDAGAIIVRGGDKIILDRGRITSFARSDRAEGGSITLQANKLIYLKDSEVTSEVFGGRGTTAGNIEITTPVLVQNDSQVAARATEGTGGKIQIIADSLVVSQDSAIDASSQLGIDGTVVLSTPEADVTSGLVVLPGEFVDAGSRLKDSCAVRGAAETSRFARAGRVLPARPEHPQMVSYAPAAASEDIAAEGTDLLWAGGALTIACGTQP